MIAAAECMQIGHMSGGSFSLVFVVVDVKMPVLILKSQSSPSLWLRSEHGFTVPQVG